MRGRIQRTLAVANREFQAVLRTPLLVVLATAYVVLVLGIAWLGSIQGYLTGVLDLLLPHQALVPVLALVLGYRTVLADRTRGELETMRSFPLDRATYVLGAYLGRAAVLVTVVLGSLTLVGIAIATSGAEPISTLAAHATVDSPVLYARFVGLTVLFALVALAVAVLVSAVARSTRGGLALAGALLLALVVGFDSALVAGLAGGLLGPETVTALAAMSPATAYRGLVVSLSVAPTGALDVPAGPPAALSALGLIAWLVGSLALATVRAWHA
jgi:ABC-type transport system involved in multi-copper enzyme maturation permease subunit